MADETALDTKPLRFGKHKGFTPREIAVTEPSYITWLRANVLPPVVSKELALECEQLDDEED